MRSLKSDDPTPTREPFWARPISQIGDSTSSEERASNPAGWKFSNEVISNLFEVIAARRDIRRFRADPVPSEILQQVLLAGHLAPSVGHSQPWRFAIVDDPLIRQQAALYADRERVRQAALLNPESAKRLLDLQLAGIREAPLGIVICCDRRTASSGVLGRATFPDTDLWSAACAIENIWLAARAYGLGVGWVTLFDPEDLTTLLKLPSGVETLGWLCLGWPDERPPEPGLERLGWSTRLPLADVVFYNSWPENPMETAPPKSHLRMPMGSEVISVRDESDTFLTTPGSLGLIDRVVDRMLSLGNQKLNSAVLLVSASDHLVTRYGISAYLPSVTKEVFDATTSGVSLGARTAASSGLDLHVVNVGIFDTSFDLSSRGDLVNLAGLTLTECESLLEFGRETARTLAINHGIIALGEIGIGNTTVAAALTSALLQISPSDSVGLGTSADSKMLVKKIWVVETSLARFISRDPLKILCEVGGGEFAFMVGAILEATRLRVCVVLDGYATTAAALIACRLEPAVQSILVAGQQSRERAHGLLLQEMGLEPLLDLSIRSGEGTGACFATSLLLTAIRSRSTLARTKG